MVASAGSILDVALLTFSEKTFAIDFCKYGIPAIICLAVALYLLSKVGYRTSRWFGVFATLVQAPIFDKWWLIFGLCLLPVIVAPIPLFITWGAVTAQQQEPKLIGLAVIFLGLAALALLYAILQWRASRYRMTTVPACLLLVSLVLFLVYQLEVIFLIKPFSFIGTSCIFLCYNMLPMILVVYKGLSSAKRVDFSVFSSMIRTSGDVNLCITASSSTPAKDKAFSGMAYASSLLILLVYAIIVECVSDEGNHIGWVVFATVTLMDGVNYLMFRSDLNLSPIAYIAMGAASRVALIAWGQDLWFVAQAFVYFFYSAILAICIINRRLPLKSKEDKDKTAHEMNIDRAIGRLPAAAPGAAVPASPAAPAPVSVILTTSPFNMNAEKTIQFLTKYEVIWALITCVFLIPLCLCATNSVWNPALFMIDRAHNQYIFGIASIFMAFAFALAFASLRMFNIEMAEWLATASAAAVGTKLDPASGKQSAAAPTPRAVNAAALQLDRPATLHTRSSTLSFASYVFIASCAIFLYFLTKSVLVITVLFFTPPIFTLTLVWYWEWRSNDYDILQKVSLRPAAFRIDWSPLLNICRNCRIRPAAAAAAGGAAQPPVAAPASAPAAPAAASASEPAHPQQILVLPASGNVKNASPSSAPGGGMAAAANTPSTVSWPEAFVRGGLTNKDYKMIGGILLNFFLVCMFGLSVSLGYKAASWVGWTIACSLFVFYTSVYPIIKYFATLQVDYTMFTSVALSSATWLIYILLMDLVALKGEKAQIPLYCALVLYPIIALGGTALYKWRDDQYKLSTYVRWGATFSGLLILAFFLIICILVSFLIGFGLILTLVMAGYVAAVTYYWVKNKFYLTPVLKKSITFIIAAVLAFSLVLGIVGKTFFLGWSIAAGAVVVLAIGNFVRFLFTSDSVESVKFHPRHVLPAFQFDPATSKVQPADVPVLCGYGACLVVILWGGMATIFLDPHLIGICVMCAGTFSLFFFTVDRAFSSSIFFGRSLEFVSPGLFLSSRKHAAEACLAKDGDMEMSGSGSSNAAAAVAGNSADESYGKVGDDGGEDNLQKMALIDAEIVQKLTEIAAMPKEKSKFQAYHDLLALDNKCSEVYLDQQEFEALYQFLAFYALKFKTSVAEREIVEMLREKGIEGVTLDEIHGWTDEKRTSALFEEYKKYRAKKEEEARERLRKKKEDEEGHRRRMEEEAEERRRRAAAEEVERQRRQKEEEAERQRVQKEEAEKRRREEQAAELERIRREKEDDDRRRRERDEEERKLREQGVAAEELKRKREQAEREEQARKEAQAAAAAAEAERVRKQKQAEEAAAAAEAERKRKEQEEAANKKPAVNIAFDGSSGASADNREVVAKARAEIARLIAQCKASGKPYDDRSFPADRSSLGDRVAMSVDQWLRPKEIVQDKSKQPQFVVGGIEASDIEQGSLGDCWFLSAVSVVSLDEQRLRTLFLNPEYNPEGVYGFCFFKNGSWESVIIDDRIPCRADGTPAFAHSKQENELWMSLMEKAYAKCCRTFEAMEGGLVHIGLVDMTGGIGDSMDLESNEMQQAIASGQCWKQLLEYKTAGFMMGAGSPSGSDSDVSELGIVQGHAYSIRNVVEVDGLQLVCLRNPWGHTEWKGDYSDESPLWTKRLRTKLGIAESEVGGNDDGIFWMQFADFVRNYSSVYICRLFDPSSWKMQEIRSEWRGESAGGVFGNPTAAKNPQFALGVAANRPTNVFISLSQEESRGIRERYFQIGVIVLNKKGKRAARCLKKDIVAMVKNFTDVREVTLELTLQPQPEPYTVFCACFNPGDEAAFCLRVYSSEAVTLSQMDPSLPSA